MESATELDDDGFTLVELLIVIVVLGILAVVTVLAVRGITDRGAESTCAAEFDILVKAQEVHRVLHASYADETTLVASGTITSPSTMYDITVAGGSYEVVSVGECAAPAGGGPAVPPVPVVMPTASFAWHGGVIAWRFGSDANGADEIVVFGREQGKADWVATTDAGAASTRRVHFIDIEGLTAAQLDTLLNAVDSNGVTAIGVYAADDVTALPGSSEADLTSHLANRLASHPAITLSAMDNGANNLQALFAIAV